MLHASKPRLGADKQADIHYTPSALGSILPPPPPAELVVQSDREQLDVASVGIDCIATKRSRPWAYRKGLIA